MLERDATQHPFLWPLTLVLLLSHDVSYLPLTLPCCNTWICLLVFFTLLCEGELFCYLVYYNFCDGNTFFCFNVSLKSGKILHEHLHNLFLDVEGLAGFRNLVVWLVSLLLVSAWCLWAVELLLWRLYFHLLIYALYCALLEEQTIYETLHCIIFSADVLCFKGITPEKSLQCNLSIWI